METTPDVLPSHVLLKKSPFLVARQLDRDDVRVYSELHGRLTTFDSDIIPILDVFDTPVDATSAVGKILDICSCDAKALVRDLFEKQFIVETDKNAKVLLSEYVRTAREKNKIPKISSVTFLISEKCNLACKTCYHSFCDFENADMDGEFAGRVLSGLFSYLQAQEIPEVLISFLGYEPLLNFETLTRIYDQACDLGGAYGIKTSFRIFTNAFVLSEEAYSWIKQHKAGLDVKVSLDGIREDNDKIRVDFAGAGSFDKVFTNLKRLLDADIECGVLTVLSKLNFPNIEKFVDEMAAIGIKTITANMLCGKSDEERRMELSDAEKIEAIRRMDRATEKYGIKFDGEWKFAVAQLVTGAHFACPAGIKQLVFSADRLIYPCQRFAGTKINFGEYGQDLWDTFTRQQCKGYNDWMEDLYNGVTAGKNEKETDLSGWSCPFLPFIRGEYIGKNLEREFNKSLIEYYLTRPMNRIISKKSGYYDSIV